MRLVLSMGLRPSSQLDEPMRPVLRELTVPSGTLGRELWGPAALVDDQFTVPHRAGGVLVQPSRTAVSMVDLHAFAVTRTVSHRLFSDVHSVAPWSGGWLVTSTGIEAVLAFDDRFELVARHDRRVPVDIDDVRQLPHDFARPHATHPSYAFEHGHAIWVTEFATQRCVALNGNGVVHFAEGPVHDGVVREGLRWFTTVTGTIVAVDPDSLARRHTIDLRGMTAARGLLGWCRGIEVRGDRLFVGMTMIRRSAWREVARWVVRGEHGLKMPTRVVEVDWRSGRIVAEYPVGNAAGGVIYAITALD
jgi:hypothetical protein